MSRSDITTETTEVSVWLLSVVSVVCIVFLVSLVSLAFVVSVVCVVSVVFQKLFWWTIGFKIKKAAGRLVFCCLSAHDVRMCPPVTSVFNRRMMCIENFTCRGSRQKQ